MISDDRNSSLHVLVYLDSSGCGVVAWQWKFKGALQYKKVISQIYMRRSVVLRSQKETDIELSHQNLI